jgi:hypothetical protein
MIEAKYQHHSRLRNITSLPIKLEVISILIEMAGLLFHKILEFLEASATSVALRSHLVVTEWMATVV